MIEQLRDSNPAGIWLREQFQTSLRLADEQVIVTRFDVVSAGYFDTVKVSEAFGEIILGDRKWDNPFKYKEYKAICESISDVLNEKMEMMVAHILAQVKMSFHLLDALSAEDWGMARAYLSVLVDKLDPENAHAERIWGLWVHKILDYLETQDNLGLPENYPI